MKKPLLIAVLAITLLLGGGALVAETAEISLDIQQQMEAVLALRSHLNVSTECNNCYSIARCPTRT